MTEHPFKMRQDTHFFHGLQASFFMGEIITPQGIGYTMQPDPFPINIDTGLIGRIPIFPVIPPALDCGWLPFVSGSSSAPLYSKIAT
jgi:hypothetical protein